MTKVYLDASILIHFIAGEEGFQQLVKGRIAALCAVRETSLLTSFLSRLECRVKPLRTNDRDTLRQYDRLLGASTLVLCEISPAIIERATDLRSRYRFSTPDAIHLATAAEHGASPFLTGDADLGRCRELNVERLPAAPTQGS